MNKQVVTKEDIKDMISSGKLVKIPHQNHSPAKNPPELSTSVFPIMMYYNFSQFLIKVDNHYVSANYLFWEDSGEWKDDGRFNGIDDKNASLPRIIFHEESGKYIIAFDSPDGGGYDVQEFEWYFDSIEDIIKEMKGENK